MKRFAPGVRPMAAALLLALAACGAGATDIATAALPSDVSDGVLQVAQRRLRLPPGHWVLVARDTVETQGRKQQAGTGIRAWIAREDAGRLDALISLSLPLEDFPKVHHQGDNRCSEEDSIERADLSGNPNLPECLGVYGHRDLVQALATRSPAVAAWMLAAKVSNPGPVVRFTYRQRTDFSYGGISLFLPTAHFESDEVASAWAKQMRQVCKPLFEGRVRDATLPRPSAPSEETAASAPD